MKLLNNRYRKSLLGLAVASCIFSSSINAACIEDGGYQVCTFPEVGKWNYFLCDENASLLIYELRWCSIKGGTWMGADKRCVGDAKITEENYEEFAIAFGNASVGANNTTTISDWGVTSNSTVCWRTPPQYINESNPTNQLKKFEFVSNETGKEETVWALRTRPATCPPNAGKTTLNNRTYCALEMDQTCPVGNPVKPGSGEKIYTNNDYTNMHGLNLTRHFRSFGQNKSILTLQLPHQPLGTDKWWYEGEKRLLLTPDSTYSSAIKTLSNGDLMFFDKSGKTGNGIYRNKKDKLIFNDDNIISIITSQGMEIYNAAGKLQAEITPAGKRINYIYSDGSAFEGINADGQLANTTVPEGLLIRTESATGVQLLFGYDGKQRLTAIRLPDGHKVLHEYEDEYNNLIKTTYPDGSSETYHYENTAFPKAITGITDATDIRYATYEYDSRGKVLKTSLAGETNTFEYSYVRNNKDISTTSIKNAYGTGKSVSLSTLKDYVREREIWKAQGASTAQANKYIYYDNNGQISRIRNYDRSDTWFAYDTDRNLETSRTKIDQTVSTQWHPFWQLQTAIAEPNLIKYWVYNGQPNPLTGETANCAPANTMITENLPIAVICNYIEQPTKDATGSSAFNAVTDGEPRVWSYSYDNVGNMLTEDGPRTDIDDITTYTYWPANAECPDATTGTGMDKGCRGQLKTETNALGHTTQYLKYDAHGNLLQQRDPDGVETSYVYDNKQRLISKTEAGITDHYSYDIRGLLINKTIAGKLSINYLYDDAHRLIGMEDNQGNSISYTLDNLGNVINEQFIDPEGNLRKNIVRKYDLHSRLQREQKGI